LGIRDEGNKDSISRRTRCVFPASITRNAALAELAINSMSNSTRSLITLGGITSDQNTVLKFLEPEGTPRDVLSKGVLNGSYRKPFLVEDLQYRAMCFALDGSTQSEMRLDDPEALTTEYTRKMMGFLLFKARPRKVLMIGLGGGSLAKYCHRHLLTTQVTVVEIDPEVIALRTHFCVPPDDGRLRVINEDGANYVAQMADKDKRIDVMLVDAYDRFGIAKAVSERSFVENSKRILGLHGIFVINLVGEVDECVRYIDIIRSVFGCPVITIALKRDENRVVFAGDSLHNPRNLMIARRNAERAEGKLGLCFPTLLQQLGACHERLGLRSP
jgi:spermidine synthase